MRQGHNFFDYPIAIKNKTRSHTSMFKLETEIEEIDRKIRQLEEHRDKVRNQR